MFETWLRHPLQPTAVQMGPFEPGDAEGDGFAGRSAIFAPLAETRGFSAGAGGTGGRSRANDDDDDDDPEDTLPTPPPTGNAAADVAMRDYRDSLQREVSRINRREAKRRRELRDAQQELADLRQNATILTGDEKAAYEQFVALGLKPAEIKAKLDEHGTLTGEVATMRRDGTLREVATVAGANFDVLRDKAGDLAFEVREVEADGKKSKVVYVKPQDGEAKPIRDYAAANWGAYMPALFPAPAGGTGGGTGGVETYRTPLPPQAPGSAGSGGGDLVDRYFQRKAAPPPAAGGAQA